LTGRLVGSGQDNAATGSAAADARAEPRPVPRTLRQRLTLSPAILREATALIVERHYLHRGRTMAQLPYWVHLDDSRVGVILFALPRLSQPFRGYHPMQLLELARLWIDPAAQGQTVTARDGTVHSLPVAGCAIAAALRVARDDWQRKYPRLPPVEACVAWADLSRHDGTVYRATNFTYVGLSGGTQPGRWERPNGGRHQRRADYDNRKAAFIFRWSAPQDARGTS